MIVLDTSILVYAVGADHPLADPCRRLLQNLEDGRIRATTTIEAVQEFAHVYARRRSRRDAARLARHYSDLLAPLVAFEQVHLEQGLRLFERHPDLGAFDALLAAATIALGSAILISADEGFRSIAALQVVQPGTSAFEALLQA